MGLRRRILGVLAGVVMLCGVLAPVSPALATGGATTCSNAWLDGDARLGPAQLPQAGPLYRMVADYQPLAGLSPQQFIATFWDPTAGGGRGGWRYPPDNGFVIGPLGPEEFPVPLTPGRQVDRFGSEYGAFLAPIDTPYASRSLPPMSLDNFDPAFTCNYHRYQVLKAFTVESGPIAPGFGQRGLGRQYQVEGSLIPGPHSSPVNVMWLLANGFLRAAPATA